VHVHASHAPTSSRRGEWRVPHTFGGQRQELRRWRSHGPPQEQHAQSERTLETKEKLSSGMHTKHCHLHSAPDLKNVSRPKLSSHPQINTLGATVYTDDLAGILLSQRDGASWM
jgi:hypothetical protein